MSNRWFLRMIRMSILLTAMVGVYGCSYFSTSEAEAEAEAAVEEVTESAEEAASQPAEEGAAALEVAEECPHGGGACCEHDGPHPCCAHTQGGEAESQPAE